MMKAKVTDVARGSWASILAEFGVERRFLNGKNGPCPICGGKDRWRFLNTGGSGTWHCNHCGNGSGIELVKKLKGWDFKTAAQEVERIITNGVRPEKPKMKMDEEKRIQALRDLYRTSSPVTRDDIVDRYLRGRGIDVAMYSEDLRTCLVCPVSGVTGVSVMPAMLAVIRDADGKPVTMHRTYLQNARKAQFDTPRRVMPGALPKGGCIRLGEYSLGQPLGIAEGIETALSAAAFFEHPVWAATNAQMLRDWMPPADVEAVNIYADNDADKAFTGQCAAFDLAHRLKTNPKTKDIHVTVCVPPLPGTDWADEWAARDPKGRAA